MPEIVGFVGSSHKDRDLCFDGQRCINMFPQISASGTSKTPAKLISAPGLEVDHDLTSIVNRGVRGMIKFGQTTLFVVAGTAVIKITSAGTVTAIGNIESADTPVGMASNGINVFFVTGPKGYVIDPNTDIVTEYTDVSFAGADAVYFINGSYVFNKTSTSQFWAMLPYSTTIDPLWFATAEGSPDSLVTLAVINQEVWLFGDQNTEVWASDGRSGFPYSRITGVFIEQGCAAKNSVVKADVNGVGTIFWLSANSEGQGMVFRTVGTSVSRVSNHSIEQEIATYDDISDAVAYAYQQEGHNFYVLTFPSQNITWVYDTATATWHQRGWLDVDGSFSRHRSNCHVFFDRKNLVGDWNTAKIYRMATDIYTDAGNPLVRLRTSPHIYQNNQRIAHSSVEFLVKTAPSLVTIVGQGSDPKVKLRWSDDGGYTFSNTRVASIGKIGRFKDRVVFTRLGQSRDRVYELSYSDPTSFTIMGAQLNAE